MRHIHFHLTLNQHDSRTYIHCVRSAQAIVRQWRCADDTWLYFQADAANKEMLVLLADFLPGRFPELFRREGSQLTNLVTQMTWDLDDPDLDHLDVCGRLVQVDARYELLL